MIEALFGSSWHDMILIVCSAIGIFAAVVTYTKLAGLRSLSKMSSFDFATTIAIGSLMASVALAEVTLTSGLLALGVLYMLQIGAAVGRRKFGLERIIENKPIVLMANGELLQDNLARAHITKQDVYALLRKANVLDMHDVRAVIIERTGDVSVLRGTGTIDPRLIDDITDGHRILTYRGQDKVSK